jgi:hypothetical protein
MAERRIVQKDEAAFAPARGAELARPMDENVALLPDCEEASARTTVEAA